MGNMKAQLITDTEQGFTRAQCRAMCKVISASPVYKRAERQDHRWIENLAQSIGGVYAAGVEAGKASAQWPSDEQLHAMGCSYDRNEINGEE